jgi:hypothetical protein
MTSAVRDATEELEAIESVLADAAEETIAAEQRLTAAQDVEARAAAVKALGAYASRYEKAASELDDSLKAVGKAFAALVDVLPETLAVVSLDGRVIPADQQHRPGPAGMFVFQPCRDAARPHDLARAILAEGLARVVPVAFPYGNAELGYRASLERAGSFEGNPSYFHGGLSEMLVMRTASQTAKALVIDRLRARAEAIASNEVGPDLGSVLNKVAVLASC